jgi:subtilase family serine protease
VKRRSLFAVGGVVALSAWLSAPAATAGPRPAGLQTLVHNVVAGIGLLGNQAAAANAPMQVAVALQRPDPAGELAFYRAAYDPASPGYHHFLTPSQFQDRFGVSQATYNRTVSWLQAGGLTIDTSSGSRDYVSATGTVAQVQRRFSTSIRRYTAGATTFLANSLAPKVPSDLPVLSVLGLNTFQRFSTPARAGGTPQAGLPNIFLTTPQALWSVYEQPANVTGKGQRVAVFGNGDTKGTITDLRLFEAKFNLPKVPVTVQNVGKGPFDDTSGAIEWNIDTQAITGMAPDAAELKLYFSSTLVDADVAQSFSAWANDPNGPAQADASFGECERSPLDPLFLALAPIDISQNPKANLGLALGNNLEPVSDQILRQATLEGRTLFSSTGDTGGSCPVVVLGPVIGAGNGVLNQILPLQNYPAASPYAVGVGGTVLYTTGTSPDHRFLEYGWPFGGGGPSPFITAPAYQQGVSGLNSPCLVDPKGNATNTGQLCRGVPDVAAQSGDVLSNGYAIVAGGKDSIGGGTSLSSPLWAGMWARVNSSSTGGYGFANETLYRLGKNNATRARDFYDIVLGTNVQRLALPGWDYVTGWGSPSLTNLIQDAAH